MMTETRDRLRHLASVVARWPRRHLTLWIAAAAAIDTALLVLLPVLISLPHQSDRTIRSLIVALVVLLVVSVMFPVAGQALETREKAAKQYQNALRRSTLGADSMPLVIDQISELEVFGVKRADLPHEPTYLSYVTRDDDPELEHHMSGAVEQGRMLLVVGDAAAGKSRSTAEAARRVLPRHRLLCPKFSHERGLPAVVELPLRKLRPAVVWLDNVEQYAHAALRDNLQQLREAGVPVIATVRSQVLEDLTKPGVSDPAGEALHDKRLIDRFNWPLQEWSPGECTRLAGKVQDPGLLHAVENGMPVGVYCVAGPQLLERVEDTRDYQEMPWRYALIRTALEWYRTGIATAAPLTVVTELMPHVASEEGFPFDVKDHYQDMDDALNWFKCNVTGGRGQQSQQSVITVLPTDGGPAASLKVHEYVLDHYLREVCILTNEIWSAALQDNSAAFRISVAAYSQNREDIALIAMKPLAEQGNPMAMCNMGALLMGRDLRSAQAWVERALHSRDNTVVPIAQTNLGEILMIQGKEPGRARELLQAAIDSRNPQAVPTAQATLGGLLVVEEPGHARELLQAAIDSRNPQAVPTAQLNLGRLLVEEEPGRARELLQAAIDSRNPQAVPMAQATLGGLLTEEEPGRARELLQAAIDSSNWQAVPVAGDFLGDLLASQEDFVGAETAYNLAIKSGHPDWAPIARVDLAVLLRDHGYIKRARLLLEQVVAGGHPELGPTAADLLENLPADDPEEGHKNVSA